MTTKDIIEAASQVIIMYDPGTDDVHDIAKSAIIAALRKAAELAEEMPDAEYRSADYRADNFKWLANQLEGEL